MSGTSELWAFPTPLDSNNFYLYYHSLLYSVCLCLKHLSPFAAMLIITTIGRLFVWTRDDALRLRQRHKYSASCFFLYWCAHHQQWQVSKEIHEAIPMAIYNLVRGLILQHWLDTILSHEATLSRHHIVWLACVVVTSNILCLCLRTTT